MGYSIKLKNSKIILRESDVVRQICKYLEARREFFWRQNNVGVFSEKKKSWLKPRYGIKGVPDIFLIFYERLIAVEVKSSVGKQSKDQQIFGSMFRGEKREYLVVRSLEELKNRLDKITIESIRR